MANSNSNKPEELPVPEALFGESDAGLQSSMFGGPGIPVRAQGKGVKRQISMDDALRLEEARNLHRLGRPTSKPGLRPMASNPPEDLVRPPQGISRVQITDVTAGMRPTKPPERHNNLADLFEVPQAEDNDIYADDLLELTEEDVFGGDPDLADLTEVKTSDITGYRPTAGVQRSYRKYKNNPPPTSLGGLRP